MPSTLIELSNKCAVLLSCSLPVQQHGLRMNRSSLLKNSIGTRMVSLSRPTLEPCGLRSAEIASSTLSPVRHAEIPSPKVPSRDSTCKAENIQVASEKNEFRLSTPAITVTVDRATGALSLLSRRTGRRCWPNRRTAEKHSMYPPCSKPRLGRCNRPSLRRPMKRCMVSASIKKAFLMSVGFRSGCTRRTQTFRFRFCYPVRDTAFCGTIASLTDFNPADQSIAIDPTTGKGKFTTGAKGTYGFLLSQRQQRSACASK